MKFAFNTLIFSVAILVLTACGGGGGSSNPGQTGGVELISITDLPFFIDSNERELVVISLNASGDGSESLMYEWDLQFGDSDISFSGQNTDTISFVAPDVDGLSIVQVDVQVSSERVELLGQDNFDTQVNIFDVDGTSVVREHQVGMVTEWDEVESIDFSDALPSSTWLLRRYSQQDILIEGVETALSTVSREIFHVENMQSENVIDISFCGIDDPITFDVSTLGQGLNCDIDSQELKYYQDDENFRAEFSCNEIVVDAVDFFFVSENPRTDFGELNMMFDTYEELTTTSACGSTVVVNLSQELGELNSASVRLVSEYQNQKIELLVVLDDSEFFGNYWLDEFFNSLGLNSVTLSSDALPTISGVTNNVSGRVLLGNSSPIDVDGSLTIETTDTNMSEENVTADFSLVFDE